ncbi:MAG: TetR/AcrR family transcriptional regulator [Bacillota bacterium]
METMDRKAEILAAFMKLVSRFGFDKTTMQDVAKEVGISVGVIYKDYKNKEDLITDYLLQMAGQFVRSCEPIVKKDLPPEQLLRDFIIGVFRTLHDLVSQDRGFLQFVSGEDAFKYMRHNFKKEPLFLMEITKMIEGILVRGVAEGAFQIEDPSKTASLFLKAFSDYGKQIFLGQELDKTIAEVEEMFSFLIRAVKK